MRASRFRVPDTTVVAGAAPAGPIVTERPFLCVEILSARDTMTQMQQRIGDYLTFGVSFVWVIDPQTQQAFVYTSDIIREVKDGVPTTTNPDIAVVLSELG